MLTRGSAALGSIVTLAMGCTTVIREEASQETNCTCMTSVDAGNDDPEPDPATTTPVDDDGDDAGGGETESPDTDTDTDGGAAESSSSGGSPNGAFCGNGIIEGLEQCDCGEGNVCAEKELGGQGCVGLEDPKAPGVLTGGVLLCTAASCQFDTSNCFSCGDGFINGNETCEPGQDIETSCEELGLGLGEVSCGDDCQVDTRGCNACGFIYTFDDGGCSDGWTTSSTTDDAAAPSWACGAIGGYDEGPGFYSSVVWGTALNGPYQGNESSALTTPAQDLAVCEGQDVTLTVRHWFNFATSDGGLIQVATANPDDEASWTTIEPFAGTFYSALVTASHPPVANAAAFSNFDPNAGTWVTSDFDLTDFTGGDLYLRFVFGSD
ncbi:MAG: hypothetical protein AAGA54_32360, partial [Myxococcota bacterium]